jgi:hypothetical protein
MALLATRRGLASAVFGGRSQEVAETRRTNRCSRPGGHYGFSRHDAQSGRPAAELCRSAKEAEVLDGVGRRHPCPLPGMGH